MLRLLGILTLLGLVFGLGFYVGRRPISEVKATVTTLSRNVLDSAMGVERRIRLRQELVEAKGRVVEAKSAILDRNFGAATKELTEAVEELKKAAGTELERDREAAVKTLTGKVEAVTRDLATGKNVARSRLDEIQRELDNLLR
jgi:hypothetical protein